MDIEYIYSTKKLNSVIDDNGCIQGDVVVTGSEIESLGDLKVVNGSLGLDCNSLLDLGKLNFVKNDFWISSANKLKSLFDLEYVGGNATLRYSAILDLGKLRYVGSKLSLRDTAVENINSLEEVKVLFLPKRFKELDFELSQVQTIKYWSDKKSSLENSKEILKDVGGQNLVYGYFIPRNNEERYYGWDKVWDSTVGFKLGLLKYKTPKDPMKLYYVSEEVLRQQEVNFNFYKKEVYKNIDYLKGFKDDSEIKKLRNRLIYDLMEALINQKIDIQHFVDKTEYLENVFSGFNSTIKHEFLPIYVLLNKNLVVKNLISSNSLLSNYSKIHELELRLKKRVLSGEFVVKRVSGLNEYILNNIGDYYDFIDQKLDELYSGSYSFYYSLFGELKTIDEINNNFPKKFKIHSNKHGVKFIATRRELSFQYIELNKDKPLFAQYESVLKQYVTEDIAKIMNAQWNKGRLWLSYNENPLSYFDHNYDGFIYYVEDVIHAIFYAFVLSYQNDFRVSKGVPKIGEGWVGETELYYKIKERFPEFKVYQHGRPKFLGRQHFDVWIPELKVAIEYHGAQHDRPIDFFGGEESFIENQKRDEDKRKKCVANDVCLFEVRPSYDFEELVKRINKVVLNEKTV